MLTVTFPESDIVRSGDARDLVRFSFIIQNSLSYLNLDLCEYSKARNRDRSVTDVANDFVNTEEKCRKIFSPSRSLLYSLHLDIPAGIETTLKNDQDYFPVSPSPAFSYLTKISIPPFFYHYLLTCLIYYAVKTTDQKLKLLSSLLNYPRLQKTYFFGIHRDIMNEFLDCFYPQINDPLLFKEFIEEFDFNDWIIRFEKPEVLEFLMYHAFYYGIDIEKKLKPMCHLMDECIYFRAFLNIQPCLKYADTPGFCTEAYDMYRDYISEMRPNLTNDVFTKATKVLTSRRIYLILQILWIHSESSRYENASEALRLLWNSRPDPYISLKEVETSFVGALSDEEIEDMYDYYCDIIGEIPSDVYPRSLKQLSRVTIRRTIKKNNFWIPQGVGLLGLPVALQSFLNLEKVIPVLDSTSLYE